jgi:hypothetical protein
MFALLYFVDLAQAVMVFTCPSDHFLWLSVDWFSPKQIMLYDIQNQ